MQFWLHNIDAFKGFPIRHHYIATSISVYTDASDYAFGGYSAHQDITSVTGMFSASERTLSSTFRELKAILYVLSACKSNLKHKSAKSFTNSQSADRIVAVGSPKPHLQSIAIDIFNLYLHNDIHIQTRWIPRKDNEKADLLIRFIDKDDWSIDNEAFVHLDSKWGSHTIDRFSSHYNNHTPRFNSKFSAPGSEAVDALYQDMEGENSWICPPIHLIPDTLSHMKQCIS